MPNSRIWQPLTFANLIREVSKSCRNLVTQRRDHMRRAVPPFAIRPNFEVWISRENRVPNNRNQRQTAGFGSLWPLLTWREKFRSVAESSFYKGGTHEPCGRPFAIRPNFHVLIFWGNWVPKNRTQRQTAGFFSLWPLPTWWGKFRRDIEISFCKGGTTWAMSSPFCYRAEFPSVSMSVATCSIPFCHFLTSHYF